MSVIPNTPKTVQEVLSDPRRWTRGQCARNAAGRTANTQSRNATCWCLVGAIHRVYPKDGLTVVRRLERMLSVTSLAAWNDAPERTHAEVLELVTKAGV